MTYLLRKEFVVVHWWHSGNILHDACLGHTKILLRIFVSAMTLRYIPQATHLLTDVQDGAAASRGLRL